MRWKNLDKFRWARLSEFLRPPLIIYSPIIYYNINFLFCQILMRQLRLCRSALTAKTQKIRGPIPEKIQFNLLHFSVYFASKMGVLKKYPWVVFFPIEMTNRTAAVPLSVRLIIILSHCNYYNIIFYKNQIRMRAPCLCRFFLLYYLFLYLSSLRSYIWHFLFFML